MAAYRIVEIAWLPRSAKEWQTFTAARTEAARLWNDMVVRHRRIRLFGKRFGWKWPKPSRWMLWVKRRYPNISAQSAQQLVRKFCDALRSTRAAQRLGMNTRFPWRRTKYRSVIYTNQSMKWSGSVLRLPHGRNEPLYIKWPSRLPFPGRPIRAILSFGRLTIVCELPDAETVEPVQTIGVDLGINTMIAAGNGQHAILVSGREFKATAQWQQKQLASIWSAQSRLQKGSRRWRRLQRRKQKMLLKVRGRIRDITHKATRIVANAFPNAKVIVGKPFTDASRLLPSKQAQPVGHFPAARIITQLAYKLNGAVQVPEHYTSQTCPVCGARRRVRRIYRCPCGFEAPRDVVGLTNIRRIGLHGQMVCSPEVPRQIVYALPYRKYPGATQVVPAGSRQVARRVA